MKIIIKLGGKALAAGTSLAEIARELRGLAGHEVCLVHGGGSEINVWLQKLGIIPKFVNGLRATDQVTMEVVEMVLSGKVNPWLVAQLNRYGVKAVGLCGKDGGLLKSRKVHPDTGLGLVGEPEAVDGSLIEALWEKGFVPVLSSVGSDGEGRSLNLNADTMACALARALGADALLLVTDTEGVCRSDNGTKTLIPKIKCSEVEGLIAQSVIQGGMIPKVREAASAKEQGVGRVWIASWKENGLESLVTKGGFHGTEVV